MKMKRESEMFSYKVADKVKCQHHNPVKPILQPDQGKNRIKRIKIDLGRLISYTFHKSSHLMAASLETLSLC